MPSELDLKLLESPAVRWRGRALDLSSRRTLPLLAYVALNPEGVTRRTLLELLWEAGRPVNLRQELAKVRRLTGAETWFYDKATSGGVRLDGSTDLARLRDASLQRDYAFITDRWQKPPTRFLLAGLDLDFLPQPFQEWLDYEESQIEDLVKEAFLRRAREQEDSFDVGGAITTYQHLARLDPLAESAHQAIIRLEIESGHHDAARLQLDRVRRIFRHELGGEPSWETLELAASIPRARRRTQGSPLPRAKPSLPTSSTTFVGRKRELVELSALFQEPNSRLITITGLGGVGKTRLAEEFARLTAAGFVDGLVHVPLSSLERADLIPASVAATLGMRVGSGAHLESLLRHLEARAHLIIFENAEHLPDAACLINKVIRRSPASKIIVTSRIPLMLQSERTYALHGLLDPAEADEFRQLSAAVELFRQRAGGRVGPDDSAHVFQICKELQALPLGIELAANLTEYLSCREIARELENGNLDLLTSEQRDRPVRHRALRNVLEEAWQALEPENRGHLDKLSVFEGEFSREDACKVAGMRFVDLRRLLDRALVTHRAGGMLTLHPVVRWFASEQLSNMPNGKNLTRKLHLLAADCVRKRRAARDPREFEEAESWLERSITLS